MKIARVIVEVPIDDDMTVIQLRDYLREKLDAVGTEIVPLPAPFLCDVDPNATDPLLPVGPSSARIHWPAVVVKMGTNEASRQMGQPSKRKNGKP